MCCRLSQQIPSNKEMEGLSAENLITKIKIIFAEYGIPCRLMSDAGSNFVSKNSEVSAAVSTLSKQCCHHITTKVMDK